jgi:hypothetical protein
MAYSRVKPETKIRIALGCKTKGINMEKMRGIMDGTLGIKISNRCNLKHSKKKMQAIVNDLYHAT